MTAAVKAPTYQLRVLSVENAMEEWDTIIKMMAPALEYGGLSYLTSPEDLCKQVRDEFAMCCVIWSPELQEMMAAFLFRVVKHESGAVVMSIPALGGRNMAEWLPMAWNTLKQMARDGGCDFIRFEGRPGWQKVLSATPVSVNYMEAL